MNILRACLPLCAALAAACILPIRSHALEPTGPAGRTVEVRGVRLWYEVRGRGAPLLLLHGGAGNSRQFEKQVPAFESRRMLILPDCCCQGRTSCRDSSLTYHAMAEDMVALLDRLGVASVDVMGWSDGGNIALDLAMHHPDRIGRVVTFGANFSPAGLHDADRAWGARATPDSLGPATRAAWVALAPDTTRYENAMTRVLALWREQPDWTAADLGRIRSRVLVCAGEHDVIRREHTEALAKAIPNARVWIVPGASHSAMIEKPELVNPRVLEFLSAR